MGLSRRARNEDGATTSLGSQQSLQQSQQMVPLQDSYMQSRTEALQNVESTILELGSIFTQLATMVAQQGEIALRYFLTSSSMNIFRLFLFVFFLLKLELPLSYILMTIVKEKYLCQKVSHSS